MKDIMEALMKKEELIPDKHDGSYELVRETVKALSTITVDNLKVEDLNLLYFSTVGTFRRTYRHKKLCINNSSLSTFEKERLHGILKRIREKANNGDYSSHGKSDHMGMFG
ncbi:MAG: hypothetical protein GX887_02700, partial [Firmicutes bacterium]|nr:hypothetical protein [Bacillota bacterium]